MLPELSPANVGAEATTDPAPGRVGRRDDAVFERPSPGGGFFLEPCARAARADQVPNLVKGNEIRHLSPYRRDPDVTRSLVGPASALGATTPATIQTFNLMLAAEAVDVGVEAGCYTRHASGF